MSGSAPWRSFVRHHRSRSPTIMSSFVEHAVSISRKHARDTLRNLEDPILLLRLASHAYAIACMIPAKYGVVSIAEDIPQIPKSQTLHQTVQGLAELSSGVGEGRLYALLVDVLQTIEKKLAGWPASWDDLPPSTELNENGPCSLTREVVHRFVGSNALKTL